MSTELTAGLADLLLGYSVDVQAGETVLISGPPPAKPLLEQLFRAAVDRSAQPVIRIASELALDTQLDSLGDDPNRYVNPLHVAEGTYIDCSIGIRADDPVRQRDASTPEIAVHNSQARSVDAEISRQTEFLRRAANGDVRWAVAFYPTPETAAEAGLTHAEFQQLVHRACMLDDDEPAASWNKLHEQQLRLCHRLEEGTRLRITAPNGTDLTLDVVGRRWISCDGRFNLPDGEVFTAPREDSATGVFAASFPIRHNGHLITGVRLEFSHGVIRKATAESGQEYLRDLVDRDTGAKRVGEVGIGSNHHLTKGTGFSLIDEKIAGTCHIGIGASYPETGGTNASSVHRDLIVDLRNGGELRLDDDPFSGIGEYIRCIQLNE